MVTYRHPAKSQFDCLRHCKLKPSEQVVFRSCSHTSDQQALNSCESLTKISLLSPPAQAVWANCPCWCRKHTVRHFNSRQSVEEPYCSRQGFLQGKGTNILFCQEDPIGCLAVAGYLVAIWLPLQLTATRQLRIGLPFIWSDGWNSLESTLRMSPRKLLSETFYALSN